MRSFVNPALSRSRRRAVLLGSAAVLAVVTATPALAQQVVVLSEGENAGNVELGAGNDRLVIDVSRIDPNTAELNLGEQGGRPAVADGLSNAGGADTVWLRATQSQTADVAYTRTAGSPAVQQYAHAGSTDFTGGMVYEASGNDTELTLTNRSRSTNTPPVNTAMVRYYEPLRLAGDGTIALTFSIQGDQANLPDRAIYVESGSTSRDQGGDGDGKLDLVISAMSNNVSIDGNAGANDVGALDPDLALIDVRNANSLRFTKGGSSYSVSATAGNHQLILGGDASIFIENGTTLSLKSPSGNGSHPGRIINTSGYVWNSARIDATSNGVDRNDRGVGVYMDGAQLYNGLTENQAGTGALSDGKGEIIGGLAGVQVAGGDNYIDNVSSITSANGAAIETHGGSVVTRNRIHKFTNGTGQQVGFIGAAQHGDRNYYAVAYRDLGDTQDLIVNSGVIKGDVLMGGGSDTFLYTGATNGVDGVIDGGGGLTDAYGVSVSASGTVSFANDLNTGNVANFEMHGVELNGPNLAVTLAAADGATLANGIKVLGAGAVTNNANITDADGYGLIFERFAQLTEGGDVVNNGDINALGGIFANSRLDSFVNRGDVTASLPAFAYLREYDGSHALDFSNEGSLISQGAYGELAGAALFYVRGDENLPDALVANIRNSGLIRNTYSVSDPTSGAHGSGGTLLNQGYGRMTFLNTGVVETTGAGTIALETSGGGYALTNANLIHTTGSGSGGVLMFDIGSERADSFSNGADGVVRSNAGGFTGGQYGRAFSFGVGATGIIGGDVTVDNAGLIEATGDNSIAVAAIGVGGAEGNTFTLVNSGVIRGGDDTIVEADESVSDDLLKLQDVLGDEGDVRVVAGAVQTWRTTDVIRNFGTIIGSVDLGSGDDRFEHYGELNGELRLGDGEDTFVLGDGTIAAGKAVHGGDGVDQILVDLSGGQDRIIDGATFRTFEYIRRADGPVGAARLFMRGVFDHTQNIDGVTVHVAAGDVLDGVSDPYTLSGGDLSETINNAGRIDGGVKLGGGDDAINNSGIFGSYVHMGEGNDVVVNSGVIAGLSLGDGDDRYEAVGEGRVTGLLEGGDGNDTFVYRLNGSTGVAPDGLDDFESFAAYGPGTLKIDLKRDYDTLEILEGAKLELTNAAMYDVGLIKGDDSSQSISIDAGFNGSVHLFGGDDTLEMSLGGLLDGDLDGGLGHDTLKLNLTAASTINDLFGFENVSVAGASPLTLTGELGAGQAITFDAADNEFIIAENAVFNGTADGGVGSDILRVSTGASDSRSIISGQLTSFESLYADGVGTLVFDGGDYRFNAFEVAGGNLAFVGQSRLRSGSGAIRFTGGSNNRFTLGYGSSIGTLVDGGDGDADVLEFTQQQGEIQKVSGVSAENFEVLAASGAGYLHIDEDRTFNQVLIEGGNVKVLTDVTLTADVVGGSGNDTFDNAGTVDGDILLGDGDDTYVARTGSSVTGQVNGGVGGNDTVVYSLIDGAGSLLDDFVDFESLGVYGPGTLTLDMQQGDNWNSVKLLEGANLDLTSSGGTIGQIIGDDSSQTVNIDGALTGGVLLGGGDDTLGLVLNGELSGSLDGGSGNDTLNLRLTGQSAINGMYGFETANISGGHALTLGGELGSGQRINFDGSNDKLIIAAGATFAGTVDGGAGRNLLRVQSGDAQSRTVVASQILNFQDLISEGAGTLALTGGNYMFESLMVNGGALELGADTVVKSGTGVVFDSADNRLVLAAGANIEGGINAGAGNDTIALAQAEGQVRSWSALQATGFEGLETSGAGELRLDVNTRFDSGVSLNGGRVTITAPATLTADVTGGDAAETFAILGSLNGDLDLGAGDDRLIFAANGSGLRSGGAGLDTLEFRGASAAPVTYDGGLWTDFEKLTVSSGVLSVTGVSDWQGLTLTGGRLVGQAGSVISSATPIEVGAGSVFGSAGTVNADINVRGTLSPGASPGTMTVNGDVSFFAGSNLLMELSPQVSDLLLINGKMNIASGATIDITGVLPSTPGQVLDLIVATDGINGRFTTVNKSSTVFGFVSQDGDKLQIRGEFQNNAGFGTNAQNSIAYANAVLGSGQAVQAFTQAVPVLVDANGVSNADAFAQLTPEAYGSALAMQTEAALSGADAGRSLLAETPRSAGKFAFARGYGASSELDGRAGTGAASADIDLGAAYAGLGYVSPEGGVVGGFVGFTNGEQSLRDLGADTRSDGVIAGAFLGGDLSGVRMGAQVTYEQANASTSRLISASGGTAKGEYDMESVAVDVNMSYPIEVSGWTVAPTVGATWVSAGRDAVTENDATSFGLNVDRDRSETLFTDIGVRASTVMSFGGSAVTPFAELGLRTVQTDGGERVTGALKGVNGFEMNADGVRRDRSVVRASTGVSYDVGGVRLSASYAGEFGDASRHAFGAGASIRF